MGNKKEIGGLVKLVAKLGLDYLRPRILDNLKPGSLAFKLAESVFVPLYASIDALSDNIEDNSGQLGHIWLAYLHNDVRPVLVDAAQPLVYDIDNEADRALAAYALDGLDNLFAIFTDDVAGNSEQLKAFFAELWKSDATRAALVGKIIDLADGAVKDKGLLELFKTVLNAVFDLIQGKQLSSATIATLSGDTE